MKPLVVTALLTVAVSCVSDPELPEGSTEQSVAAPSKPGRCPDPFDCTVNNGGGVYDEENGHVGFGDVDMGIAFFQNSIDVHGLHTVNWRGRFKRPDGHYIYTSNTFNSHVVKATYNGATYTVARISESFTSPTIELRNDDGSVTLTFNQDQLTDVHLLFSELNTTTLVLNSWTLSFGSRTHLPDGEDVTGDTHKLQSFPIYWNDGTTADPTSWHPYCEGAPAPGHAKPSLDYGVFQQGIQVDPLTAQTVFNVGSAVTLSCRKGAIATARAWGYTYREGTVEDFTLFEAAMHMKRASYCGDITTYTKNGIQIAINDTHSIQQSPGITNSTVEARWGMAPDGRIRALCVNTGNERLRGSLYPTQKGVPFDGTCYTDDGLSVRYTIPSCRTGTYPALVSEMPAP